MKKIILHPLIVFCITWGAVIGAYTLHWSELQVVDIADGLTFIGLSLGTFVLVSTLFHVVAFTLSLRSGRVEKPDYVDPSSLKLSSWFFVWAALTLLEVIFSGGVPIIWALTGSSKTYFDFGIPTVHGFLNSLISSISLIWFWQFLQTKERKYLFQALFVVGWAIIVVTRQLIIVNLFQFLILWVALNRVRVLSVIKLALLVVSLVLGFGWLGDARTGADKFIGLAMPTESYPDYLPSGVLWVYMYAVTPFMNLLYSINTNCGCESPFFGNTLAPLLPSFLRNMILPSDKNEKGNVISEAFNVSTAFVDPYTDNGYLGIVIFSAIICFVTLYFWNKKSKRELFIFCVLGQSMVLTIFYNHFFSLPVITQIFWFYVILRKRRTPADVVDA
jgi:oligosaccharide repeat unit polymerase